jgi:hypothetical protein
VEPKTDNIVSLGWVVTVVDIFACWRGVGRYSLVCNCMEVGSVLSFVVSLEGKKLEMF